MIDTGLLMVGKKSLQNINSILNSLSNKVRRRLYVQLLSSININSALAQIYLEAHKACTTLDVRVLLYNGNDKHFDEIFNSEEASEMILFEYEKPLYRSVVLGGTFDRLHNAHKFLLSRAALIVSDRIVCGVTYDTMIERKCLWELIEPLRCRQIAILDFIQDITCGIQCELHSINDPFGPSVIDANLDAIIVSNETLKGAHAVNEEREKRGLPKLFVEMIELLSDDASARFHESKISSSTRRRQMLGDFLKPLHIAGDFPKPFVIGLTGGSATGKSRASMFLSDMGCEAINCDKVAHNLYSRGSDMAKVIRSTFGDHIVEDGVVDRKALGRLVFSDKEKLAMLNNIVWPSLLAKVKEIISLSTADFIVIDAAVLLEADWDKIDLIHQIWCCILPHDEAKRRLIERDQLSPEQAEGRLNSQLSNYDRIQRCDVVICSLWDYNETNRQLLKAFSQLQALVNHHS